MAMDETQVPFRHGKETPMIDHPSPTYKQHIADCNRISIALIQYVKELHEIAKFSVDEWAPAPCPPRGTP